MGGRRGPGGPAGAGGRGPGVIRRRLRWIPDPGRPGPRASGRHSHGPIDRERGRTEFPGGAPKALCRGAGRPGHGAYGPADVLRARGTSDGKRRDLLVRGAAGRNWVEQAPPHRRARRAVLRLDPKKRRAAGKTENPLTAGGRYDESFASPLHAVISRWGGRGERRQGPRVRWN